MDTKIQITVCTLATGALWFASVAVLLLISAGLVDGRHATAALVPFLFANVLYMRRLASQLQRRELAAYRLGREFGRDDGPDTGSAALHPVR